MDIKQRNSTESGEKSHLTIIESSAFVGPPVDEQEVCIISQPIPRFFTFKSNFKNDNSIFLSPFLSGSFEIYSALTDNNFVVSLVNQNSSFIIKSDTNSINNYSIINISKSPFPYIEFISTTFHVFSTSQQNALVTKICQIPRNYTKLIIFLCVVYLVILMVCLMHQIRPDFSPPENLYFWVFDQDMNKIYGIPLESIDAIAQKYLHQTLVQTHSSRSPSSSVIRLKRGEFTHKFQRSAAFPLPGGYAFAVIWEENLPEASEDLAFTCEFKSEEHSVIEPPKLSFTSFRDTCPVHLNFTLDNNVNCQADLPASILAPFQPYGQLVTVILSIFYDLVKLLTTNPFIHTNFQIFSTSTCQKINARRAFFFLNGKELLFEYHSDSLEPLPKEVIDELPTKVNLNRGFIFEKDLITENKRYFVNRVNSVNFDILTIIELEGKVENDFFEIFGLPFFTLCCVFMFQLSFTKEQNLRFERFIKLLTGVDPSFTFCEASFPSQKLTMCRSKRISEDVNSIKDIIDSISKQGKCESEKFIEAIIDEVLEGKSVFQRTLKLETNNEKYRYLSFSANCTPDPESSETIMTMLVEDVTEIKKKESEQLETLHDLQQIVQGLGVVTFSIVNGHPILDDSTIFDQLNYKNTDNISLMDLVVEQDKIIFQRILNDGEKKALRLIAADGTEVWYYAVSDTTKEGFMLYVNDLTGVNKRLQTTDEGLQLAATSSSLVFWVVDPKTDLVHSIFMQPTIWDSLSVDRDMKFSRFSDFVHEDDRENIAKNLLFLENNEIMQWIGEVRLIRVGGAYEWHRVAFSRAEDNSLHCLALNIHQQKEMESKLRETQKLRDLLLSSGKLALWRFNDNNEPIEKMHRFDPGLQNSVTMNWTFVQEHVHPDYRDLLSEKMRRAFNHEDCIEMDLPLILDEEIWVSVRGKKRGQSRQVVGVCIDITELRNAYNELEKEKRRAEEANRQKTVFLANMSHEIRTPMNGIFGMLDVLALKELTSEQRLLDDSIRASSFQLMKLLDDTLNLTKIEQGEIEWKPQIFDLSKLFEPICIATASRARLSNLKLNVFIDKCFPLFIYGDSQLFSQVLNNLLSNALKFTKEGSITIRLSWVESNSNEFCILEVSDTGIGISKDQQRIIFERFSQADASTARFFGGTGLGLSLVQDIVRFLGGSVSVESEANHGTKFIVEIPFESIYVPYSPPFSDKKQHVVLIDVVDEHLKSSLIEWISYQKYVVISFANADDIVEYSTKLSVEAIFVEGNSNKWQKYAEIVNSISTSGKIMPIVSMCEAGEPSYFKYTLAKPVQYFHLVKLLNGFRYGLQNISSSFTPINNDDQLKRILVVEDNKANQFVMKKILETLRCTYMIADNGKEAITILDKEEFDIVFMDCQMPVLDGIEATRIIRRSGKMYASIPIIALTASAVEGDEQTCREAGMDGYLAKPVRIQQINDIVKQFYNH